MTDNKNDAEPQAGTPNKNEKGSPGSEKKTPATPASADKSSINGSSPSPGKLSANSANKPPLPGFSPNQRVSGSGMNPPGSGPRRSPTDTNFGGGTRFSAEHKTSTVAYGSGVC
jgi:hypothetical protein